jgi:outer membrane protein OmpA-like peptidoglycan-associated protein
MIDPLAGGFEDQNLDPLEVQRTLMGFLGQTYQEVSRYDNNIVSANPFLAPKKQEFHNLAQKVLNETRRFVQPDQQHNPLQEHNHLPSQQYTGPAPIPQQNQQSVLPQQTVDPNQLEFSFDNSVTAITINNKLNDLEKKLKRIDSMMEKVILFVESYDSKNTE